MVEYEANDYTEKAREVCGREEFKSQVPPVAEVVGDWSVGGRRIDTGKLRPDWKCAVRSKEKISYGDEIEVELGGMEQVESKEMGNGILMAMHMVAKVGGGGQRVLGDVVDEVLKRVGSMGVAEGLGGEGNMDGGIVMPRKFEIMGALGRLRIKGLIGGATGGGADGVKRMKM